MSTATIFDAKYATRDPWGIAGYQRRTRALAAIVAPHIRGKRLLELGCGEGHMATTVFRGAAWITGVDISAVAIARAPRLPNAEYLVGDQRTQSLIGYHVVSAIECLHYLAPTERDDFFARLSREHRGTFLMMTAIEDGGAYFTHAEVLDAFARHGLKLILWRNVYANRRPGAGLIAATASRLPGVRHIAAAMPKHFVCHRAYVALNQQLKQEG